MTGRETFLLSLLEQRSRSDERATHYSVLAALWTSGFGLKQTGRSSRLADCGVLAVALLPPEAPPTCIHISDAR